MAFKEGGTEGIISGLTTMVDFASGGGPRIVKLVSVWNPDPNTTIKFGFGVKDIATGLTRRVDSINLSPGDSYKFGEINEIVILSGLKSLVGYIHSGVSTNPPEYITSFGDAS